MKNFKKRNGETLKSFSRHPENNFLKVFRQKIWCVSCLDFKMIDKQLKAHFRVDQIMKTKQDVLEILEKTVHPSQLSLSAENDPIASKLFVALFAR